MKAFIKKEAINFPDLEVKYVGGDPRIKFFNNNEEEIGHVDISAMTKLQIVDMLENRGLKYDFDQSIYTPIRDDVGDIIKN